MKKQTLSLTLIAIFALSLLVNAQENTETILQKIKANKPERYEKIMKLKENNPEKFKKMMQRICKGKQHTNHEQNKNKYRKQFMMKRATRFLSKLKTQNPAEYQRLLALKTSDPKAFKKALKEKAKEIIKAKREKMKATKEQCQKLAKAYKEATDDAEKAKIKTALEGIITKTITERLEEQTTKVQEMEARLKDFKEKIEQQKATKASIIQKKVEQILSGKLGRKQKSKKCGLGRKQKSQKHGLGMHQGQGQNF